MLRLRDVDLRTGSSNSNPPSAAGFRGDPISAGLLVADASPAGRVVMLEHDDNPDAQREEYTRPPLATSSGMFYADFLAAPARRQ